MAYGYYPQYFQPQTPAPVPTPAQSQSQGGIIWVQGEAGAKSFMVAPNTTVQLWDSERQTIYLKSADASGMPTTKILDYTIRDSVQPQTSSLMSEPVCDYITREEFNSFVERVEKHFADNSKKIRGGKDNE